MEHSIAYVIGPPDDGREEQAELFAYDLDRDHRRLLASPVSPVRWVSLSPGGRWLLIDDWRRERWLFVREDGHDTIERPAVGGYPLPRWCCSSPSVDVPTPFC